jgi:Cell division protein CrgA
MATKAKAGPGKAQKKGRSSGGRTTEAGKSTQSSRYTPPIPKNAKTSPRWMGILIIALFLLGVLVVILNYAGVLPGGVNNLWLVAAIGAIFAGLILATRYH